MNSITTQNSIRFIVLILVQVLVLSAINFLGYINPYAYVLGILIFPVHSNRSLFLILSFGLGLILDLFLDSGGVHAVACLIIAYVRPVVLKFSFGTLYDHNQIKFTDVELVKKIVYFAILIMIHHTILFSLEIFNLSKLSLILKKSFLTSIFTLILSVLIVILFSRKR